MFAFDRRTLLASLMATVAMRGATAATWPERPVTWIVPFPAGGGSDLFARPIAQRVAERLGQPNPIDNRSGAGGTVGTAVAARATPDGYTLLLGDTGLTYAPVVYPAAGFDFGRDFMPISALSRVPYVLVVNPRRLEGGDLKTFIAKAKAKPGGIDVGSAGMGTITHLAIGLFEQRAGVSLNHVPYRGGAPMLQDLLAGQIDAAFVLAGPVASDVRSGKLKALAVANRRREQVLPDVPTMEEAGLPDFRVTTWFGVFAPRGTPEPVLDRLHGAIQEALQAPAVRELWQAQAARVELEPRADFVSFVKREVERWGRIAKASGVKLE